MGRVQDSGPATTRASRGAVCNAWDGQQGAQLTLGGAGEALVRSLVDATRIGPH